MNAPNASHDLEEEKPLDPAAERVRRKLVRFMGINLAILFTAVMAVVLAFVYKSLTPNEQTDASSSPVLSEGGIDVQIALPDSAEVVSHGLSGNRLTIYFRNPDGSEAIEIFGLDQGQSLGQIEILREEP